MSSDEIREAARALLGSGFQQGTAASLVRRHRRQLAELFRDDLGWQVVAEDDGPVRALRQPGAAHVPRGLTTRSGRPFDPTRYALLFLVLASLEAAGARITLTLLFDDVQSRAADVDTLVFDRNQASHRRAFVHAVQAVVDLDVLELADGSEETFATSGQGDALYRVERAHLTRILATSKPPSLSANAADAVAENLYTDTEQGQLRLRRHRLIRALVSETVVYRSDLSDDEIEYLTRQLGWFRKLLDERFGLTIEARAEGWVAVDCEGTLSDQRFPAISAARAAALAIVDASRARRSAESDPVWPIDELRAFVGALASQFGKSWPLDPDDTDGISRVSSDAVDALVDMRLARREGATVVILPAAGRFALTVPDDDPDPLALDMEMTT